jgi:hypothetical protein
MRESWRAACPKRYKSSSIATTLQASRNSTPRHCTTSYRIPPEGYKSWEEALKSRGVPQEEWNSASAIVDPEGGGPRIYFQQMDTPKLGKNRIHLDLNASSGLKVPIQQRKEQIRIEVERLLKLGAKEQREWEEQGEYWVVMLDPEGNEFCVQ